MKPTADERCKYFRDNAESFVENLRIMVAALEKEGKEKEATNLRVWALMPWEAVIRDDDNGDLWPVCEACGEHIKSDIDLVSGGDVDLHRRCIG